MNEDVQIIWKSIWKLKMSSAKYRPVRSGIKMIIQIAWTQSTRDHFENFASYPCAINVDLEFCSYVCRNIVYGFVWFMILLNVEDWSAVCWLLPHQLPSCQNCGTPDNKVLGANMGPIWDQQDPGGPRVGPMNLAIWDAKQDFSVDFLDQKIIFWYKKK